MAAKKKGFTLIELLVVVAIIIILAMILMSAFFKAQEKAKQGACLAHGRQLGMALMMYVGDYDETFPIPAYPPYSVGSIGTFMWIDHSPETFNKCGWSLRFFPPFNVYVKNEDIWICPSARWYYGERYALGYKQTWDILIGSWSPTTGPLSVDSEGHHCYFREAELEGRTLSNVAKEKPLSEKIAADCFGMNLPWSDLGLPYFPHNRGTVYVYADGHSEWHKMGNYCWPVGYKTTL